MSTMSVTGANMIPRTIYRQNKRHFTKIVLPCQQYHAHCVAMLAFGATTSCALASSEDVVAVPSLTFSKVTDCFLSYFLIVSVVWIGSLRAMFTSFSSMDVNVVLLMQCGSWICKNGERWILWWRVGEISCLFRWSSLTAGITGAFNWDLWNNI